DPRHREGAAALRTLHRRHRRVRAERGVRRAGAGVPGPLRHPRRRPAGQPVGRGDRGRPPAGRLRRTADDPARPALRRAPAGALRDHRDVRGVGHGRQRHLGEPELGGEQVSVDTGEARATDLFPDELVTRALPRLVRVPGLDRPAALITLDNGRDHTRPNTLGPGGLASLDEAISEALAAEPAFVAVTGKPYSFCAGADLAGIGRVRTREQARELGRAGHRVFGRLRDAAVPTFAFINGAALGGGLELALHCDYRSVSSNARALALPEVRLGLVPAWGGSQLLPNLIGIAPAVQV